MERMLAADIICGDESDSDARFLQLLPLEELNASLLH